MAHVGSERQRVLRDPVARLGTGLQCPDSKAMALIPVSELAP
jgi:hypothetical protein